MENDPTTPPVRSDTSRDAPAVGTATKPALRFSCPYCGSALRDEPEPGGPMLGCRLGHHFSRDNVMHLQFNAGWQALNNAVRCYEEAAALAAQSDPPNEEMAADAFARAALLRRLIFFRSTASELIAALKHVSRPSAEDQDSAI